MIIKNTFIHKPIQGSIKQYGIWIQEDSKIVPLVFFRKPKWVPEDQWAEIVNAIEINLPRDYLIEGDSNHVRLSKIGSTSIDKSRDYSYA